MPFKTYWLICSILPGNTTILFICLLIRWGERLASDKVQKCKKSNKKKPYNWVIKIPCTMQKASSMVSLDDNADDQVLLDHFLKHCWRRMKLLRSLCCKIRMSNVWVCFAWVTRAIIRHRETMARRAVRPTTTSPAIIGISGNFKVLSVDKGKLNQIMGIIHAACTQVSVNIWSNQLGNLPVTVTWKVLLRSS